MSEQGVNSVSDGQEVRAPGANSIVDPQLRESRANLDRREHYLAAYQRITLTVARCGVVLAALALPFSTSITNVAFGLSFLAWLLSGQMFALIKDALRHPVARGALVLLAMVLVGLLWSDAPAGESADAVAKYRKLLLLAVLLPILNTPFWQRAVVYAFFGSIAILLLISTAIFLEVPGFPGKHPVQGAIVMKHHITHGFLMALLGAAAIVLTATVRDWRLRTVAVLIAALALTNAVLMTHGRTGYAVFAALLILAGFAKYRFIGLAAAAVAVVVLAITAYTAVSTVQQRVDLIVSEAQRYRLGDVMTSTGIRLNYYVRGFHIVRQHPLIGAGTGSWPLHYGLLSADDPPEMHMVAVKSNPHSEYLLTAVQWGAVGLVLHVSALLALFVAARQLPLRRAWLAQSTVVAFAVGSLFNSFFWDTTEGHAVVLLLAALYGGPWPPDQSDL